jgi:hypothetical protein
VPIHNEEFKKVPEVAFRSYFSPLLKSKYLSYELFGYTYEYLYEVVLLLRALSKQS